MLGRTEVPVLHKKIAYICMHIDEGSYSAHFYAPQLSPQRHSALLHKKASTIFTSP